MKHVIFVVLVALSLAEIAFAQTVEVRLTRHEDFEADLVGSDQFDEIGLTPLDKLIINEKLKASGADTNLNITPDRRLATLKDGQTVYYILRVKPESKVDVKSVTFVLTTAPKTGAADITANYFKIHYTEAIGSGQGIPVTDVRDDSTSGKAYQVITPAPTGKQTYYFSFTAVVKTGGVHTHIEPHFFAAPGITSVEPTPIVCCCVHLKDCLAKVPTLTWSSWYGYSYWGGWWSWPYYYVYWYRKCLLQRLEQVTATAASSPCSAQEAMSKTLTIHGDRLPVYKTGDQDDLDTLNGKLHVSDENGDMAKVAEILESTKDKLVIRLEITRCSPGTKRVTMDGVGGIGTVTFLKLIVGAPDTIVCQRRYVYVRVVGTEEKLSMTMNIDNGANVNFSKSAYQCFNISPVSIVSKTSACVTTTGGKVNGATIVDEGTAITGTDTLVVKLGDDECRIDQKNADINITADLNGDGALDPTPGGEDEKIIQIGDRTIEEEFRTGTFALVGGEDKKILIAVKSPSLKSKISLCVTTTSGTTPTIRVKDQDGRELIKGDGIVELDKESFAPDGENLTKTVYIEGLAVGVAYLSVTYYQVDCCGKKCDIVKSPSILLEFITKDNEEKIMRQQFTYNSIPRPKIDASVDSININPDGLLTVSISGTVTDEVSDIVEDPRKQVQDITVIGPNGNILGTIHLTNVASPERPWRPYKFEADFAATFDMQIERLGETLIRLVTSENAAGCSTEMNLYLAITREHFLGTYNIVLAQDLNDGRRDSMQFFVGEPRPGLENEILIETTNQSKIFTGTLFWAGAEVEILDFAGLTNGTDTIEAHLKFSYSGSQTKTFHVVFVELGPTTGRFVAQLVEEVEGFDLGGNLSVALPSTFAPNSPDGIEIMLEKSEGFYLFVENSSNSLAFNGDTLWGDVTVELVSFQGLTDQIDTINARWTLRLPNGDIQRFDFTMIEDSPVSNRFIVDLGIKRPWAVTGGSLPAIDPGTYSPTAIRVKAPDGVFSGTDTFAEYFDSEWNMSRHDFGDGEYWYVVDETVQPAIFLCSLFAQEGKHKRISEEERTTSFVYIYKGPRQITVASEKIVIESGLLVLRDDVSDMLGSLRNWTKTPYAEVAPDNVDGYVFKAPKGEEVEPLDNNLETEILWRYVDTKNTVRLFHREQHLKNDIVYHKTVVENARNVRFKFVGSGFKLNGEFWGIVGNVFLVLEDKSTTNAIKDMWTVEKPRDVYQIGCSAAAIFAALQAASVIYGAERFDDIVGDKPYNFQTTVLLSRGPYVDKDARKSLVDWIPGEVGYLWNKKAPDAGENVIYLGGCFKNDVKDVEAFIDEAMFWGHIEPPEKDKTPPEEYRITTLKKWSERVNSWGELEYIAERLTIRMDTEAQARIPEPK